MYRSVAHSYREKNIYKKRFKLIDVTGMGDCVSFFGWYY